MDGFIKCFATQGFLGISKRKDIFPFRTLGGPRGLMVFQGLTRLTV
jgi:hypothetical protein